MFERLRDREDLKIAIYCRVSTDEQAKNGYSIKDQKIVLENIILDNKWGDYDNTTYYIDDGYSGRTMQRPRFQALLNDIKLGNINLVVCTSQDRIGRENEYNSFWIKYLVTYGAELYVKDMPGLDIYTDTGVLNYHITSAFSEFEVKKIRARAEAGIIRSFLEGNYANPQSPYGYDKVEKKLVVNEAESEIVKLIHTLYVDEDLSILSIKKYLNTQKIGNRYWNDSMISKILRNDVYIGHVTREDLKMTFYDLVPKIVSDQVKERVKLKLKGKSRNTTRNYKHIYRGKIYCVDCDEVCINDTVTKENGTKYRYYLCGKCRKRINEKSIDDQLNPLITLKLLRREDTQVAAKVKLELKKIRREQVAIVELYDLELISRRVYRHSLNELKKKVDKILISATKKRPKVIQWVDFPLKDKKRFVRDNIILITVDLTSKDIKDVQYQ